MAKPWYFIDDKMRERLDNDYRYHAPIDGQVERYAALRAAGKEVAEAILANTPPSREQSVALTHLETAIMFANAAIARNEKPE